MPDPWDDVRRAGEWLLDLEVRLCPDLIHLNSYAFGDLPWRAPVLAVGHSCVLSWWRAVKGESAPPEWTRYREAVGRGLRAVQAVVAPTRAMLEELERLYGPLPAARVVPNGRDPALFPPRSKEPFILTAGRLWDEAKNVAALQSSATGLSWPVYVAGEEHHPASGERTGASSEAVRRLGRLTPPEMSRWLGRAAIYALPARYEPFGLSILEAAFAGCALVLGDIPSLREVWGDTATFVDPEDVDALSAALDRLIDSPEERQSMAARARVRAFEYTPERMAAGYLAVYRQLLQSGRRTDTERVSAAETAEEEPVCVS
jgi:glycogen synthase